MSNNDEIARGQWKTALAVTLVYVLGVSAIALLFDYLGLDFFKAPFFYLVFLVFIPVALYRIMLEIVEGGREKTDEKDDEGEITPSEQPIATPPVPCAPPKEEAAPPQHTIAATYSRYIQDHPIALDSDALPRPFIADDETSEHPDEVIDVAWVEPEQTSAPVVEKTDEKQTDGETSTGAQRPSLDRFSTLLGNARRLADGHHFTMAAQLYNKAAAQASTSADRNDARMGAIACLVKAGQTDAAWTALNQLRADDDLDPRQAVKLDMMIRLMAR